MTKTRVLAALIMAPLAICGVLFLPTPWLMAIAALLFLLALWAVSYTHLTLPTNREV